MAKASNRKTALSTASVIPDFDPLVNGGLRAVPALGQGLAGQADSESNLARINAAAAELKIRAALPFMNRAVDLIRTGDVQQAALVIVKALEIDERNGLAWHILAIARERSGDFATSIQAYESAMKLLPDQVEIAYDLGRLAHRLGMTDVSQKLFAHYLQRYPFSEEAINNFVCTLRDQQRYEDAIDYLRPAIERNPASAILWTTLGTILAGQSDYAMAVTFFNEALNADPDFQKAQYNRGNAYLNSGDAHAAFLDSHAASLKETAPEDRAMMQLACATHRLADGQIQEGWEAYEVRLDPNYPDVTLYFVPGTQWTPETDLRGKRMLVVGEQGLGDEILFAHALPDLIRDIGEDGELIIAVEPRLVDLFARSFPGATVTSHHTGLYKGRTARQVPLLKGRTDVDCWAAMGSLLRKYRNSLDAFKGSKPFLSPDPAALSHWKSYLDGVSDKPKIGLLWKSLKLDKTRANEYDAFDVWKSVLQLPGFTFVNLQYGDASAEIALARERFGVDIHDPQGIDLKLDLDQVAALTCALDLVIGPMNATSNLASACGAPVWVLSNPASWPRLGTDYYPWYPKARPFISERLGDWGQCMQDIEAGLRAGEFR